MTVPSVMNDLSITVSNNSPAGSESPISTDDFHRAIQAILRTTNAKASDIASAATTDIGAATAEFVDVTGTTTITGLGTIGAGIVRTVRFTGALTLTHNATSLILPTGKNIPTAAGDVAMFRSLGSGNWVCVGYMRANGFPLNQRKGADVASATALPLINDGNYFDVTGTTTITSFASLGVGSWIGLHFDGALILTHHATDLVLPGGANITTAAGDEAIFVEYASGDWRCVSYTKADGTALKIADGAVTKAKINDDVRASNAEYETGTATDVFLSPAVARARNIVAGTLVVASGTSVDFTSIPSWVKRVSIMFNAISTTGTSPVIVQLGSGSVTTSGYTGAAASVLNGVSPSVVNLSSGFSILADGSNTYIRHGFITLQKIDGNLWSASGSGGLSDTTRFWTTGGTISLSGALDRVRITTVGGTETFDNGSLNIIYE